MPHYLIERTFHSEGKKGLPGPHDSLQVHRSFTENNNLACVRWIHSYVTPSGNKSFCLYEGPTPEAVRQAAGFNGLPVDRISEVHMQAPYENTSWVELTASKISNRVEQGEA